MMMIFLFLFLLETHAEQMLGKPVKRYGILSHNLTKKELHYEVVGMQTRGFPLNPDPKMKDLQMIGGFFTALITTYTLEHHFTVLAVKTSSGKIKFYGVQLWQDAGLQFYGPYDSEAQINSSFGCRYSGVENKNEWWYMQSGTKLNHIWDFVFHRSNPYGGFPIYDLIANNCQKLCRDLRTSFWLREVFGTSALFN